MADHSFGLTLDGQAQTIQALLRAFPPGAVTDGPDLPLARATIDVAEGRLNDAAAHLTVAEALIAARRRQTASTASKWRSRHSACRWRASAAISPAWSSRSGSSPRRSAASSDEDIALDSDLRAVALMNLGIVEAWTLANRDSERHLQEGAALARRIGRPYLEVACLAELGFASKIEPLRHHAAAVPGGDSPRRAPWLGRGAGHLASAGEPRRNPHHRPANSTMPSAGCGGPPGSGDRHRARHQAAAAPGIGMLSVRPPHAARGACRVPARPSTCRPSSKAHTRSLGS